MKGTSQKGPILLTHGAAPNRHTPAAGHAEHAAGSTDGPPANTHPRVTVIVPCKGQARQLAACLRSLVRQSPPYVFEVVVVDSALDPRVAAVAREFPGVHVLRSGAGLLRSGSARNLAARESTASYLAFIDADAQAERGWLEAAVARLEGGAQLVGGPVLDALPWHPVAVADNLLQFADLGRRRATGPCEYVPACNMAVRRESFLAVGGFPELGPSEGDSTALCRAILARWQGSVTFVNEMRVRHDGRTGVREFARHQSRFGYTRAMLGLTATRATRRGTGPVPSTPMIAAVRLGYVGARSIQWDPGGAPRRALVLPLVLGGAWAWATAFRRGCAEAVDRPVRETVKRPV